jgi:hypothetical protein
LLLFSPKSFFFPFHIKEPKIKIYKTVILPVVLYGCETWSLILGEEHRLKVFESSVLRMMRWVGHVARMWEGRGVHRVLVGRPEDKRPLGRPRRRWKDNIKMDLRDIGIGAANWIRLAHDGVRWRVL